MLDARIENDFSYDRSISLPNKITKSREVVIKIMEENINFNRVNKNLNSSETFTI